MPFTLENHLSLSTGFPSYTIANLPYIASLMSLGFMVGLVFPHTYVVFMLADFV